MIIYLCMKCESNTLIFSKDIERKPFFKAKPFFKVEKRAITPKIIGGFYPKSNLHLWLYTCVLNFNPIHGSFQKILNGNYLCYVRGGQDGWWLWWLWYYMHPRPPPCPTPSPPPHTQTHTYTHTENGGGIKMTTTSIPLLTQMDNMIPVSAMLCRWHKKQHFGKSEKWK